MEWIKDTRYTNVYYISKQFNGFQYNAIMTLEETDKSVKCYFSASSGKKRKEFEIFEDKDSKSFGGIKALFWLRDCLLDFSTFFAPKLYGRNLYLCVAWSDNRRRNIYQRLEKEGFIFMREYRSKILMKKIEL